jgi:catechol 2,3-dioxygenase-like lactoylglutathione lyase family enzyme
MTSFIRHIALFVPDLRQAEAFYQSLFDMELIGREAELADGLWYTLPFDKGWEDAQAAEIKLGMVALQKDEIVLAFFQGKPAPEDTVLEIGLSMAAEAITNVHDHLPDTVALIQHERGDLLFKDPFGYTWHVWPADEAFLSNGESVGRWIEL